MALLVKTGSYTGNGSDPQSITGIGFEPKVVYILGTSSASATLKMDNYPSNTTTRFTSPTEITTSEIGTFTSDGFPVSDVFNTNTVTYYYVVLGGSDVVTGMYTGNGTDDRDITGIGFTPGFVFVRSTGGISTSAVMKSTATGASSDITQFFTGVSNRTDRIQALQSDGFQVGADGAVNQNTYDYYYFAIREGVSNLNSGQYTGDGTDDRNITGVGFTPLSVLIKSNGSSTARNKTLEPSDNCSVFSPNPTQTNEIQEIISDGFQLGTGSVVNSDVATYTWIAFGESPIENTGNFLAFM